ncbi:Charged multivesicular body protein 6 [Vanrija pseudolonga]|uniref:Charged multivesicular body protein 6 n=1 Tax=Vanrija pseudolonga TaxID=143232 RepID=A0AAF0Y0H6_9TREE|nr:Charged multivesicular body protein 6 [Vanrija pseudolonga]
MGLWQNALVNMGLAQQGPKITAQDRAVLDLKLQRDRLKQYQKRIQVVLDREHEIAKDALAKGDKRRALTALRQRKYQEQLLTRTDGQLQTLQDLVSSIEFTQIQAAVVHGLEQGSAVLKQLQKEVSLERVEKLMDQSREGIEYQREIDEALASQMSPEEEEAVQRELEELQREALPKIPDVPDTQPISLPDAPVDEPAEAEPAAATKAQATHPALPVAADILSTLRHLTAPGKGNDLRAEERTALVGVAALLGCERVQSHDLLETAVQRASSVSPARFKSALATSRRLLAAAEESAPSPSRRRPATQAAPAPTAVPALSPFATPKKKFKYASGVDLSGLVSSPHKHSPATGSPLRSSASASASAVATPSKRAREVDDGDEVETTPTKPRATPRAASARKTHNDDDVAAFFALRPGAGTSPDKGKGKAEAEDTADANLDFLHRLPSPPAVSRRRTKRPRRDWTYAEAVWALPDTTELLDGLAANASALRDELADDADTEPKGTTLAALVLATWS